MAQGQGKTRASYRWNKEARAIVAEFTKQENPQKRSALSATIRRLTEVTGFPRHACARFVRQSQDLFPERRAWSTEEQQKLLDLIATSPLPEAAMQLHRSVNSVRSMLHKLGASATMGKDWFTKHTLASALHIGPYQVQKWLDSGLLKSKMVETGILTRQVIESDAFAEFCREHRELVLGRRINPARLDFIQNYVFPANHSELLPVRESKRERSAFELQQQSANVLVQTTDEETRV